VCNAGNGLDYFFTVDARTGTAPGGVGSPDVTATPRSAGSKCAAGTGMGATINGTGYATITTCLPTGLPTGIFVAVGLGGAHLHQLRREQMDAAQPGRGRPVRRGRHHGLPEQPDRTCADFRGRRGRCRRGHQYPTGSPGPPVSWATRTSNGAFGHRLGTGFVAVGDAGRIQTSTDGVN